MLFSLAIIFLAGLAAALCRTVKLPGVVGMLAAGIILGPHALNLIDGSVLGISSEIRQIALIIILMKAGLSLDLSDLKKVGRSAVLLAFVPASFEILGYFLLAPALLGVTRIEAAVTGSVLAAVSPAVVVPRMLKLMDDGLGTEKGIPQMIIAGASCDDIFVIVLFSTFSGMAAGGGARASDFIGIPVSIILGVALGAVCGLLLTMFFELCFRHGKMVRNSVKLIILLSLSFLLVSIETWLKGIVPVSGLLAVVSMACVVRIRSCEPVTKRLSEKTGKLWLAAEMLLFVLVGAAVDVRYLADAGVKTVVLIFAALAFRAVGVTLSLTGTKLNAKERLFTVIAYIPKATVQAAIGSVPLAMGLPCGNTVLTVAVMGIIITAPLGALGIDLSRGKLLDKSSG